MDRYTLKDFPNYSVDVDKAIVYRDDKAIVYRDDKPLKPSDNGTGYLQITLCKNGTSKIIYLHHAVYCAKRGLRLIPFKQRLKDRNQNIHHKDTNRQNNSYSNIELVSALENQYLRKIDKLPYPLINVVKGGFCFSFQSNGYEIRKFRRDLDYLIRYRDLFLCLYNKDVYNDVMRIEKKYSRNIKSYQKKTKLSPKNFI